MAEGYAPPKNQVRDIAYAARSLYRTARDWEDCYDLPGAPVDIANELALRGIFALERSLNPKCVPAGDQRLSVRDTRVWPPRVRPALAWLLNLMDRPDGIISRHGLEAMRIAPRYEAWAEAAGELPEVIRFGKDELSALRHAIGWLLKGLAQPIALEESPSPPEAESSSLMAAPPIALVSPVSCPWVNGVKLDRRLTAEEYAIISALVSGPLDGLSVDSLKALTPDAEAIIRRLLDSDEPWSDVLWPWEQGGGYAVASEAFVGTDGGQLPEEAAGIVPRYFVASKRAVVSAWLGKKSSDTPQLDRLEAEGRLKMHTTDSPHRTAFRFANPSEHARIFMTLDTAGEVHGRHDRPPTNARRLPETCTDECTDHEDLRELANLA